MRDHSWQGVPYESRTAVELELGFEFPEIGKMLWAWELVSDLLLAAQCL